MDWGRAVLFNWFVNGVKLRGSGTLPRFADGTKLFWVMKTKAEREGLPKNFPLQGVGQRQNQQGSPALALDTRREALGAEQRELPKCGGKV